MICWRLIAKERKAIFVTILIHDNWPFTPDEFRGYYLVISLLSFLSYKFIQKDKTSTFTEKQRREKMFRLSWSQTNLRSQRKEKVCKDQELKQSEPKSSPQN